jgi:positive regulator of sigma E activity
VHWIARQGRVVDCHGSPVVRFTAQCGRDGGCTGVCGMLPSRSPQIPLTRLDSAAGARYGDRVTLLVAGASLTRLACLVFALPLAALLAGAWLGEALAAVPGWPADFVSGLAGLAGLMAAGTWVASRGAALERGLHLMVRLERTDL